jgi:anti-sigma B factor antagonist
MAGHLNGSDIAAPADKGGFGARETWFDTVVVISVSGALDLLTAPVLVEMTDVAVTQVPAGVIVDLSKVDFLASAGMNVLVAIHRKLTPSTRFGVVADSPVTSRPLKMLGLDKLIALYPTLSAALEALTAA